MKKIKRDKLPNFHQAKWDEPIIFEHSVPGERGVLVPKAEKAIVAEAGDGVSQIPQVLVRKQQPGLPEMNQKAVLKHYLRLSQMTLGGNLNVEIGQGTCTMKYNPPVNDQLAENPKLAELHPLQDESTVQGILEIMYKMDLVMREVSGMDYFTFQAGGGSQSAMAMASIIRSYFEHKGEAEQRDEIITTIYSHPSDAAAPATIGYKVIKIPANEDGLPDYEAFKAAVSERTAAFIVANPEDTGIYNSHVREFTKLVHEHGGLCGYDQANANGLFGVTRAREAGFDMCFFNLHKSFGAPHGCGGPGSGSVGVRAELRPFLPRPLITYNEAEDRYFFDYDMPESLGRVRPFHGNPQVVLKAYAWTRSLGAEGLYEAAKIAVLNNNYLIRKILENDLVDLPYPQDKQLVEQARYSLAKLEEKTGLGMTEVVNRVMDFGMHMWTSHHPYYVPEPMTLEPTETPSRRDLDAYVSVLNHILEEATENPEILKTAPHNSTIHQVDESNFDDPEAWIPSWRVYQQKTGC
ncbi:MAG: aminomethyl-transferring glycine dehydrogenase subunit GcvPB [Eubacteriales bacterium]|nr:aminomethyl-transferring glycine dehydrogenase subunit GcvPB [Eubacteriales bacterium]